MVLVYQLVMLRLGYGFLLFDYGQFGQMGGVLGDGRYFCIILIVLDISEEFFLFLFRQSVYSYVGGEVEIIFYGFNILLGKMENDSMVQFGFSCFFKEVIELQLFCCLYL